MNENKYKFKSVGIVEAIAEYAPGETREVREDFVAMVEGRIRRESAGWGTEVLSKGGKAKELKQPKPTQKVGWGETPTLTLGNARKVVIPSTACGQIALLDEAYANLEKHGVGYFPGVKPDSYVASKLAEFAKEFAPAPAPATPAAPVQP